MANTKEGKEVSKINAIKHGLYIHFADFFPCNFCKIKDTCKDFAPGSTCSIDAESFKELMKTEFDELEILRHLIYFNQVRLNRATNQLSYDPTHLELTRICSEIRNLVQTYHIIKNRKEWDNDNNKTLSGLPKQSKLHLLSEK